MTSIKTLAVVVASAVCVAGGAHAANVIGNGGFEAGTGTDADAWQSAGSDGSARDSSNPFDGTWALRLNATGAPMVGASSVGLQNSIADGGQPGLAELTSVDVSFQWFSDFGPGGVASASVRILDSEGNIVDSQSVGLGDTGGAYQLVSVPTVNVPAFGAAPADEYAVFIEFSAAAGAFDGSFSGGYIDNVVAEGTFVPEPGSLALLGLGGLVLARRRRCA